MKRVLFVSALLLAGTLLFAGGQQAASGSKGLPAGFNATGLPIVTGPIYDINVMQVRYRFHGNGNVFNTFYTEMEKNTNVRVNWETRYTADFNEQRALMLASGDLPEAIWGSTGWDQATIEANKELFLPLDDLIDKYMPNLKALMAKDPAIKRAITYSDGKIYSLPGKLPLRPQVGSGIFINKTWLDKLGLAVPTTTKELGDVLKAFKTRDPNGNGRADEIPWYTIWNNATEPKYELTTPFGASGEFLVENGKAFHTAITDQFRNGVEWAIDLYQNGVFPSEFFTMSSDQFYATGSDTSVQRFGFILDWTADATIGGNSKDFIAIPPVRAPDGAQYSQPLNEGIRPVEFMITTKCQTPEVVARWVDQFYTPDATFQKTFGAFGDTTRKEADGSYTELPLSATSSMYNDIGGLDARKWLKGSGDCGPGYWPQELVTHSDDPKINLDQIYISYIDPRSVPPLLPVTAAQATESAALQVAIKSYIVTTVSDWMVKGAISNWDGYVAQLKTIGIDRLVAIWQDQYDRTINFK